MKRILILIVLFPTLLTAQWEIVHQNKWEYFTSIDLVNDTLGFITTEDGYILKTIDGGLNWEECNKLNWTLSDIQFIDESYGWILGRAAYYDPSGEFHSTKLLKTEDGGQTWNSQENDIDIFWQYQFITPQKGWAIISNSEGEFFKLIFTLDGGASWKEPDTDTTPSGAITNFSFVNENVGWVIGGKDYYYEQKDLFKTEDGGNSWTKFSYQNEIQTIIPTSDSVCYVFFDDFFYKTVDGGSNWIIYNYPQGWGGWIKSWVSLNDSSFILTRTGRLHDPDVICTTTDGFKTFETVHEFGGIGGCGIGSFWAPSYVKVFDSNNGIALNNSYIMRTVNEGENWDIIGANQNFKQLNFVNEQIGYVNDVDGYLLKTDNGGKNWNIKNVSDSKRVKSFYFINEDIGFAVGINSVYKTINGGNSWEEIIISLTDNDPVNNIYFLDDKNGWALSHEIYQTIDCGENWTKININEEVQLNDLDFINKDIGFLVCGNSIGKGVLLKTFDGGNDWTKSNSGNNIFTSIDQVSPKIGFSCGHAQNNENWVSVIYRSDDSWGSLSSWTKQYEKVDANLRSIYMIDSLNGFVCGTYYNEQYGRFGYILKTNNGGKNWEEQYSIYDIELNDIQFINENLGWAVGENGLVIRTTNGGVTWVDYENLNIPNKVVLHQNYPNPFNPNTTIKYTIPSESVMLSRQCRDQHLNDEIPGQARNDVPHVVLKVYDILGREVTTLVNQKQNPGYYEVEFDGSDLTSGIYLYKLEAGDYIEVKKMLMIK